MSSFTLDAGFVSVIINVRNGEDFLAEAIESVYAQSWSHWEILVFDNASTDGTSRVARSFDHRVRCISSSEALSLGRARNAALSHVAGQFVAFLDSDDRWLPNKLEKQLALFSDPAVGVAHCNVVRFGPATPREVAHRPWCDYSGRLLERLAGNNPIYFSSVVARAVVFQHVQFDPRLSIVEDWDVLIRLAAKWQFGYLNEPQVEYRMHPGSLSASDPEQARIETSLMVEGLSRDVPGFGGALEMRLRAQNTRDLAVLRWKQGRSKEARALLRTVWPWKIPWMLNYVAFFVRYRWCKPAIRTAGALVRWAK